MVGKAAEAAGIVRDYRISGSEVTRVTPRHTNRRARLPATGPKMKFHAGWLKGFDHPVIYEGQITTTYKAYSDNLAMFFLKGFARRSLETINQASRSKVRRKSTSR